MYRACGQEHTLAHTHIEAPKGLAKTTVLSRGDHISIHKSFLERIGTTILGTLIYLQGIVAQCFG